MATLNNTELTKDVDNLVSTINLYGGVGIYGDMHMDFLMQVFTEFVASGRFIETTADKRKEFMETYEALRAVLIELDEFSTKYPNEINISNVEAQTFE